LDILRRDNDQLSRTTMSKLPYQHYPEVGQ